MPVMTVFVLFMAFTALSKKLMISLQKLDSAGLAYSPW